MRTFAIDCPLQVSIVSLRLMKEINGREFQKESACWKLTSGYSLLSIEKRPQCCGSKTANRFFSPVPTVINWSWLPGEEHWQAGHVQGQWDPLMSAGCAGFRSSSTYGIYVLTWLSGLSMRIEEMTFCWKIKRNRLILSLWILVSKCSFLSFLSHL